MDSSPKRANLTEGICDRGEPIRTSRSLAKTSSSDKAKTESTGKDAVNDIHTSPYRVSCMPAQ